MTNMTNWVAALFMGGAVFFIGLALICLAMVLRLYIKKKPIRSLATILAAIGILGVLCSATPMPLEAYVGWLVVLTVTFAAPSYNPSKKHLFLGFLLMLSVLVAIQEISYQRAPVLSTKGCASFFVVGDSLSLGADPPGKDWPELLGNKIGLPTKNLSTAGAMLDTALRNAEKIDSDESLILLEIGGNDLLNGRKDFKENLDRLLKIVCKPGRQVVMMELPLPPFFNFYGTAQRSLARIYGITLIPKRYLAATLAAPGATEDGLHLSNTGHELLADKLQALFTAAK